MIITYKPITGTTVKVGTITIENQYVSGDLVTELESAVGVTLNRYIDGVLNNSLYTVSHHWNTYTAPSGSGGSADLTATTTDIKFSSDNTNDIGASGASRPRSIYAGTNVLAGASLGVLSDTGTFKLGVSSDLILNRDAANTLALRNGASAQTLRLYNTYTDSGNYERAAIWWSSNQLQIKTEAAGSGTVRDLIIQAGSGAALQLNAGGGGKWTINSSGNILAQTDASYDIGASGANRPRNLYASGTLTLGGTASLASDTALFKLGTSGDVILARDGANILAQRNGVNAQVQNVYNTYTDASNYERGTFGFATNVLTIGTEGIGTGQARKINFVIGGVSKLEYGILNSAMWNVLSPLSVSGNLTFNTDNTYDIGASASTRPRTLYAGTSVITSTITTTTTYLGSNGCQLRNNDAFAWSASTNNNSTMDTFLYRDGAASTIGQRNGVNAQVFNIYNTYTDASNYERGFLKWSSNIFKVGMENLGTGLGRAIQFILGSSYYQVDGNGLTMAGNGSNLLVRNVGLDLSGPQITGSSTTPIINLAGTWNTTGITTGIKLNVTDTASNASSLLMDLQVGSTSKFSVSKGGTLTIGSNATIATNGVSFGDWSAKYAWSSGTSFGHDNSTKDPLITFGGTSSLLKFGGTTFGYPALKRNNAQLQVRVADDSAYGGLAAEHYELQDGMTAPSATSGLAKIYVDSADGDLKIIFGDGVIKTIVVDT